MNQKAYTKISAVIFLLIAVMHALRIGYQWEAIFNGVAVPMYLSWVALVVSAVLAYFGFKLSK